MVEIVGRQAVLVRRRPWLPIGNRRQEGTAGRASSEMDSLASGSLNMLAAGVFSAQRSHRNPKKVLIGEDAFSPGKHVPAFDRRDARSVLAAPKG